MKEEIRQHLDHPRNLEQLYRSDKMRFKAEFNLLFPEIQESPSAKIWNERLNFTEEAISWGTSKERMFILVASCIASLLAHIPELLGIEKGFFYPRNIAVIIFPLLIAYFAAKQQVHAKTIWMISALILGSIFYINYFPDDTSSDTLVLACIHLPFFLWSLLGIIFLGGNFKNYDKRLNFLKYNGNLIVMTTIILIAGMILSAVTLGLFNWMEDLQRFYMKFIVVGGVAAAPIVGTYLVQNNPQLVNKISPVIAKIFTPLVLLMLIIYLIAVIVTGKDPYQDRDFLIVFNALLIVVMVIILFSITETSKKAFNQYEFYLLFALASVTIIVNGIALSAILFRISEWGITPNRLAVLCGNLIILTHLLIVTYTLFKTIKGKHQPEKVWHSIVAFLPIYSLWTIIVVFIFPLLFHFQ